MKWSSGLDNANVLVFSFMKYDNLKERIKFDFRLTVGTCYLINARDLQFIKYVITK
jgi:hypothetical protein